jgi:outer membrane murein-binding lipoprotein Lpp
MENQPTVITPSHQSPEREPSAPDLTPVTSPVKVKHATKFILGYLVLILLVAALGGVYSWQHKKVNSLNSQVSKLNKQVASLQACKTTSASSKATASSTTTSPYAGWKTYTLPVEKLSFMYPSDWTVSNDAPTSTQDATTLTSSDGFSLSIEDGVSNGGDSITEAPATTAVPVTFVGQSDYLVFTYGTGSVGQGSSDGLIAGAVLQTSTNENGGPGGEYPWPTDKTAVGPNDTTGAVNAMYIVIRLGFKPQLTLQQAPSNSDFKNAVLIIKSMHY